MALAAAVDAAVVAAVVAAYLTGTFPTAALVTRRTGHDVAREGSGNPGASNVYRIAGRRAGAAVFAGDLLKGVLGTALGLTLAGHGAALACGAAAVVGHCFPATRGFRGGKGVATGAGFVLVVVPAVGVAAIAGWLVIARLAGRASLASLAVVLGVPLGVFATRGAGPDLAAVTGVALLIAARHRDNLRRLVRGEERTLP